jgi:DNA repair exonuclease SbcCD ATPase subunit
MTHKLDTTTLENPYIQVIWEDTAENFTQERIRSVKQYFQKKYASNNINVVTKIKTGDETQQTIDVSVNIMDKNYQRELVQSLIQTKGYGEVFDKVMNIDNAVEARMITNEIEVTPFKKWYIRKIEFSNFLSYGENQVIDFDKCNGITIVESDPPNFGGKTVLTVDLLMFLFFNTTTKTQKAEDIFNRFTDKNKVSVRGEITIDGEDYIIARNIERKKNKAGEWNVKTELDFFKKLPNGELINFTGEQRRETEEFIKKSIGEQNDFLMTILTTASNLEELIESKPTARGQVLSRFLGLEFIKQKEEAAKEIYSEFSKSMISNVYNTESLRQGIDEAKLQIQTLESEIEVANKNIEDVDTRLKKGQDYKENLISSKHTDLDQEIVLLNPQQLEFEIKEQKEKKKTNEKEISEIKVVEPKKFYHEDKHDEIKENKNSVYKELLEIEFKINEIEKLKDSVGDGIKCEHCGIELMNASITRSKIEENEINIQKKSELTKSFDKCSKQEQEYVQLKKDFDEYEKNKLIKEKFVLSLESTEMKLSQLLNKKERYEKVQEKIKENKEIEAKLIKANMRIDELMNEKRGHERIVTSNQINIKTYNDKIDKNNELISIIAKEFEKEKIYKIYLEIFGKNGISKIIMKTMMPVINQELQRLLIDSCYFNLEIRINEKNEVDFVMSDNTTGIEKSINTGSGYEKTIASMALRAVLAKVSSLPKPNLIAFDEAFGKISNDNLDMVGEFFLKIKNYFEKIFVISHNPLINNWGDTFVKITKVDNISKVIQKI